MEKPCIEYIIACAWCEVFGDLVQVLEKEYEGKVHVKIYRAGKDFDYIPKYGANNNNAHLTEEEAQYILDNRDKPLILLYEEFSHKLTYEAFRKVYHHQTYTNLITTTSEYPYNREFAC